MKFPRTKEYNEKKSKPQNLGKHLYLRARKTDKKKMGGDS